MDTGYQSTVLAVFQNRFDFYLSPIFLNLHIPQTRITKRANRFYTFRNWIISKLARSDSCAFQNRFIP